MRTPRVVLSAPSKSLGDGARNAGAAQIASHVHTQPTRPNRASGEPPWALQNSRTEQLLQNMPGTAR